MACNRFTWFRCCALTGAILAGQAGASTYRVGHPNDQDCTHDFAGAVAAANANPGKDFILLGFDQANVAASISDALEIRGGYEGCGASAPTPGLRSTLIGNGIDTALFVDAGDDLDVRDVEITGGGSDTNVVGGGIWKNGAGYLSLYNTVVYGNRALLGGGIAVTGANAMALLYAGTRVNANSARRGGGIYVDEAALRMDYADVAIHNNSAVIGTNADERFGGGIYATGTLARPAEVSAASLTYDIGEPHPPLAGVRIYLNVAHDGAGIYANGAVSVLLRETTVQSNIATRYGGGIFLMGNASLQMLRRYATGGLPVATCDGRYGCSALYGNVADFGGAAISLWNGAQALIAQTLIARNSARDSIVDSYIQSVQTGLVNRLTLEATVIADNDCTATSGICRTIGISNFNNRSIVNLRHVTMADNRMQSGASLRAEIDVGTETPASASVSVHSSIIEPMSGNAMVNGNQPALVYSDCSMGPGPFPNATRPLQRTPPYAFVARAVHDYRLGDGDPAIDGCDGTAIPPDTMLTNAPDHEPYGNDDPYHPNRLGAASTHDIGAFETLPLLRNGFD